MANSIVDYFRGCQNLDTDAGRKLVSESDDATMKEATEDPEVAEALLEVANNATDPYLRRSIFKALGT